MIRAARNETSLRVVLSHRPIRHISLDTIQHVARTFRSHKVLQILLDHNNEMYVTEEIVLTALESRDDASNLFGQHPEAHDNFIISILKCA